MPLSPGEKLGPYEIVASIGAGGMGEVYKARDTRLDRTVAVKVLPAHIAERADARARFEREARSVASLNHPHICTLHDIGPGYMVMELIEGETLAARLAKSPLPLEQALKLGGQIADALDRAHRAGVTHRDVKPQNIMLARDGVKVLDFGLAKSEAKLGPEEATLTAEGTIMGTPQYMAPEQFEGREADTRSDIWAFGAVLYEMVAGRKAFEGQNYASLVTTILAADPAPIAPGWLDRLLRRCLAKDPEDRWQSMRDILLELRSPQVAAQAAPASSKRQWLGWAVAAALAGALVAVWAFRPKQASSGIVRFTVSPAGKDVFSTPPNTSVGVPQFALAPDGSAIVFVAGAAGARPQLWVRSMADAVPRPLAGTEDAAHPFWSPDSQWIAYFSEKQLRKIPAAGGAAQTLATEIADTFGGTWGPDNTILYSAGAGSISKTTASGGAPSLVTTFDKARGDIAHRWPQFLPDGKHFLYYARAAAPYHGIYLGSLDGTASRFLFKSNSSATYAPPGYLLFVDGDTLLARRFDSSRLEVQGDQLVIASGVGKGSISLTLASASATGMLVYSDVVRHIGQLTWFDRRGNASGHVGAKADYLDFRLAPGDKRLAFSRVDPKTNTPQIWTADLERGTTSPITFDNLASVSVLWAPDGGQIVFRSTSESIGLLYRQAADGGSQGRRILTFEGARSAGIQSIAVSATDWSSDAQSILFSVPSQTTGFDIWTQPAGEHGSPKQLLATPGDQGHANFSPDGKQLAYSSNESGKFEVYVQTFPLSGRKAQVSTAGGFEPRWRADGREIYYIAADGKLMAVSVTQGLTFGVPQALFQTQHFTPGMLQTYYVPDRTGQRFLVNTPVEEVAAPAITVTLNWAESLKK